jgi:hypothetical protein
MRVEKKASRRRLAVAKSLVPRERRILSFVKEVGWTV